MTGRELADIVSRYPDHKVKIQYNALMKSSTIAVTPSSSENVVYLIPLYMDKDNRKGEK